MGLLILICLFWGITLGFVSKDKPREDDGDMADSVSHGFVAYCKHAIRDVCFEFVEESMVWSQAGSACRRRGGELLRLNNCSGESFLRAFTHGDISTALTWWLHGEGAAGERERPPDANGSLGNSSFLCPHIKLNPFELITSSDCGQRRGHLCALGSTLPIGTEGESHSEVKKTRFARSAIMSQYVDNMETLLQEADKELMHMEMDGKEPSNENRENFIKYLLAGTKKLTPSYALSNNYTINHIINCSAAILLLSLGKCDVQINPPPKSLFEQIFEIYRAISILLGQTATNPMIIRHGLGTIYQTSHSPSDLDNAVLGSELDGTFVKFPAYSVLKPQLEQYSTINAQLATFYRNPHPSNDSLSEIVCSVFLNDGRTDIRLVNLTEMIEIYLPRQNPSELMNTTVVMEDESAVQVTFNITDPDLSVILDVEPSANVSLLLLLSPGVPPNLTSYSSSTVLNQTEGYRWIVTPSMLEQRRGLWYINTFLFNSTWEHGLTLEVTSFVSKCVYWDIAGQMWSSEGCQVGKKSTPEGTQCLCNHLTLFGSSFFVMPNYVDISRTAKLFTTVSENYVVLALLCAFFGLYMVTLLWACYADRRALSRRKMTLLEDNHPCALYNYLLSVQTGHRKNAGTSANATVRLIGTEAESETQSLSDPIKPVLERGAVDMFLLSTPFPLGELQNIRLQHDNTGGNPSWYINKVTVQDLQTRKMWQFLCDCWLSSDRGDGMTKKMFNAAKKNEIASFRYIFQSRTSTGFRDEHIWVSILDPPWRSPFTRAQRVSCCMSLLLCTMAINIAFWNIPKDQDSPVLFTFGYLEITWQEIVVGVESGLLMFPINILIITIFRSIKPRLASAAQKRGPPKDAKPLAVTMPSILKETEEMVNFLSKSRKNKVPELRGMIELSSDLAVSLDRVHEVLLLMQGEGESDPHWVYCSKFVLSCLSRLLMCLEKVDIKNFSSAGEYQKVLGNTNLLVRKAEMVLTSHKAYCPPLVTKRKKALGCRLPWWCVFLGWFLLLSISGISTFFTLLYGLEYGRAKSIQWVISLGLSLFQSIFILQPLKVIGVAVLFALLLKPVAVEEAEEVENVLLEQREKCRQHCGWEAE